MTLKYKIFHFEPHIIFTLPIKMLNKQQILRILDYDKMMIYSYLIGAHSYEVSRSFYHITKVLFDKESILGLEVPLK